MIADRPNCCPKPVKLITRATSPTGKLVSAINEFFGVVDRPLSGNEEFSMSYLSNNISAQNY
jgi:hypothetical protein